jgi:hypothetical protein
LRGHDFRLDDEPGAVREVQRFELRFQLIQGDHRESRQYRLFRFERVQRRLPAAVADAVENLHHVFVNDRFVL